MSKSHDQQRRTGRTPLTARQRLFVAVAAPIVRLFVRLVLGSCRLRAVHGQQHLDSLIEADRAALLCCWHQRLAYTTGWLLAARSRGLRPGFLVSPSRDGELIAAVVGGLGATVLRGSANRTGARAFRDMYTTLKSGVSPILAVDGPHGPAHEVKSGTLILAQMAGTPILPITFAADRYWQFGTWDRMIVPKPFARITVHIGAPAEYGRANKPEAQAQDLGNRLQQLDEAAELALGSPSYKTKG